MKSFFLCDSFLPLKKIFQGELGTIEVPSVLSLECYCSVLLCPSLPLCREFPNIPFLSLFLPYHVACRISVPWTGIEYIVLFQKTNRCPLCNMLAGTTPQCKPTQIIEWEIFGCYLGDPVAPRSWLYCLCLVMLKWNRGLPLYRLPPRPATASQELPN